MLAGATTASSTISTHTSPVLSDSPVRTGRHRGLSYLRSHLHHNTASPTPDDTATETLRQPLATELSNSVPSSPTQDHGRNLLRQLDALRLLSWPSATASSDVPPAADQEPSMARHRSITSPAEHRVGQSQQASQWLGLDFGLNLDASDNALPQLPANGIPTSQSSLPSIQFIPATEPHRSRPSLDFRRVTRVLRRSDSIIRVGRYSERDNGTEAVPHIPSDAPIGFKSKVVSRRHCEFSYSDNQWFIKDVKSSSGTFLNHIRLSQPGLESKLFPVNDGDIVQLGIDFKGGEEMIFRCVKIRIETNRGWQKGLNKFNKSTHKQLLQLAKGRKKDSDATSKHSTECTICLNSIAPCQALFVAPCSHTWHYKCISTILDESRPGQFLCPNCRAQADLDADVEEEELEDFEVYDSQEEEQEQHDGTVADDNSNYSENLPSFPPPPQAHRDTTAAQGSSRNQPAPRSQSASALGLTLPGSTNRRNNATLPTTSDDSATAHTYLNPDDLSWTLNSLSLRQQNTAQLASLDDTINTTAPLTTTNTAPPRSSRANASPIATGVHGVGTSATSPGSTSPSLYQPPAAPLSAPLPIRGRNYSPNANNDNELMTNSPTNGDGLVREGPMTPRNDAGPFVFDGSGGSGRGRSVLVENEGLQ